MSVEDLQARQKILVVDDSNVNRQMLGELLRAEHEVLTAKNGEQGLELARAHRPDLVLLDVMMPGMDGYEVLRRLRAEAATSALAVIFITGLAKAEDEERGLQHGAADYITKPFQPAVVRARVALHLRLARQYRMLESLANIDALTEIPNRRQCDVTLEAECRRTDRERQALSVALLDVDFFKQYNDQYGHAMGDRALRSVAQVLRQGMRRPGDLGARYGGEEFVLIMPNTDGAGATALADRVRCSVEAMGIAHARSAAAAVVTISVGVATAPGGTPRQGPDLLKLADERLYQAKAAGRNRVVCG